MLSNRTSQRVNACDICHGTFPSRNKLFTHIREMHTNLSTTDSNLKHECNKIGSEIFAGRLGCLFPTVKENDEVKIIIKPQNIATMGGSGLCVMNSDELLLPGAIKYRKAVPCHRLDQTTGGLLLCSKTKITEVAIKQCFRHKLISKRYVAICIGKIEPSIGTIETAIGGQPAITKYQVTHCTHSLQYGFVSTVLLNPITGKHHQLRKHMSGIGHPIIGDRRYSSALTWPSSTVAATDDMHVAEAVEQVNDKYPFNDAFNNLFLWSVAVRFPDPIDLYSMVDTAENMRNSSSGASPPIDDADIDESMEDGYCYEEAHSMDESKHCERAALKRDFLTFSTGHSLLDNQLAASDSSTVTINKIVCRMVSVEIPEPSYYLRFRQREEQLWNVFYRG